MQEKFIEHTAMLREVCRDLAEDFCGGNASSEEEEAFALAIEKTMLADPTFPPMDRNTDWCFFLLQWDDGDRLANLWNETFRDS